MKEKEIREDQEAKADSKTAETPAPQELGKKAKEAKETKASQKPQDSQDSDDPKEPAEEEEHEESFKEAIAKQALECEEIRTARLSVLLVDVHILPARLALSRRPTAHREHGKAK